MNTTINTMSEDPWLAKLAEAKAMLARIQGGGPLTTVPTPRAQIKPNPDATWTPPRSVDELTAILAEAEKFGPIESSAAFKILKPEIERAQAVENFRAKQRIHPEHRYLNRTP